jgi:hypothetical protein
MGFEITDFETGTFIGWLGRGSCRGNFSRSESATKGPSNTPEDMDEEIVARWTNLFFSDPPLDSKIQYKEAVQEQLGTSKYDSRTAILEGKLSFWRMNM